MSGGCAGFGLLRSGDQLHPIDDPAWQDLERELVFREYRCGEQLLVTGQPATQVIFVLSGVCREYFLTQAGEQYNKAFVVTASVICNFWRIIQDWRRMCHSIILPPIWV